tara:strand:- start:253 stop:735 length:483 start_codon:yes stop_codon:yes gene_type:complete
MGLMFFSDPYKAFANIYQGMTKNGILTFMCFQEPQKNFFQSIFMKSLSNYIDFPKMDPKAPGPFAFASQTYVKDILLKSNFKNIEFEGVETVSYMGKNKTNKEFVDTFMRANPSIASLIKDIPESEKKALKIDLETSYAPYKTSNGFSFPTAIWVVSATT